MSVLVVQVGDNAIALVVMLLLAGLVMLASTRGHGVHRSDHGKARKDRPPPRPMRAHRPEPTADGSDVTRAAAHVSAIERDADRQTSPSQLSFVHMAAHELSNPMTPVVLAARMLRGSLDRPDVAGRHLDTLERGIDRMRRLLDDLLEAARLQDHRLPVTPDAIDLRGLTAEIASGYEASAQAKGLQLAVLRPEEPVLAYADAARVAQVLANLIDNAIKYTPCGGRVVVRVAAGPAGGTIEVSDDGIGMTPEQQARLFQAFARVHGGASRAPPGNGLGLYLAKGIVEAQGGTIGCHSAGPGKGTTFTVRLPDVVLVDDPDDGHAVRGVGRPRGPRASGA